MCYLYTFFRLKIFIQQSDTYWYTRRRKTRYPQKHKPKEKHLKPTSELLTRTRNTNTYTLQKGNYKTHNDNSTLKHAPVYERDISLSLAADQTIISTSTNTKSTPLHFKETRLYNPTKYNHSWNILSSRYGCDTTSLRPSNASIKAL